MLFFGQGVDFKEQIQSTEINDYKKNFFSKSKLLNEIQLHYEEREN